MNELKSMVSRLHVATALASFATIGWAQDLAKPADVRPMCPAVIATVMVGKFSCSAAMCNTGAAQGGWLGLATQLAHRGGAIDAESFSVGFGAQLSTALKQTGCFTVLDAASIEAGRKELEALGRPVPPPPTVDFFVRSDVTRAELVIDESSLLGYKSRSAKSSLGIDTKLISASSGAVAEAGSFDAVTERKSSGIDIGIYRSGDDAARRATPFADVARELVAKAAVGLTTQMLSQVTTLRSPPSTAQLPLSPSATIGAAAPQ